MSEVVFKTYTRRGGFLWPNVGKRGSRGKKRIFTEPRIVIHGDHLPGTFITHTPVFAELAIRTGMIVAVRSPGTMEEEVDVVWNPWKKVEGFTGKPSDRRPVQVNTSEVYGGTHGPEDSQEPVQHGETRAR